MKAVVHIPIDVKSAEGEQLASVYPIGQTYPAYILADSAGEIINRWTGYFGAASFVKTLLSALQEPATVKERNLRLKTNPSVDDALFLARYHAELGQPLRAAEFYQKAQALTKAASRDFTFDIFQSLADAAWMGLVPFDTLIPLADEIMRTQAADAVAVAKAAGIISNVARKTGRSSEIGEYLLAGIEASGQRADPKSKDRHNIFTADFALFINSDTTGAIETRKAGLGAGWETRPDVSYAFARWCLERKINLGEAEALASRAVDQASGGRLKAAVLGTLAEIYEARGEISEALQTMRLASDEEPDNIKYSTETERLKIRLESGR